VVSEALAAKKIAAKTEEDILKAAFGPVEDSPDDDLMTKMQRYVSTLRARKPGEGPRKRKPTGSQLRCVVRWLSVDVHGTGNSR
jgi:hypothetical protein